MNTDRLFEFQVLAQTLHYGVAADKLYISQSVLSRHIQSLEAELGIRLFSRTSHSVALTSAGIAFYRLSKEYMNDVRNASENARVASLELNGSVKVGIMMPTMSARIRSFLRKFSERYPHILVSAEVLTNFEVNQISEYHYLTLASSAMITPDNFELYHFSREKGCLILPFEHPLSKKQAVSFKELENEILFLPGYSRSIGAYARIGQIARQATEDRIRIMPVANPETAILNVELGRGFSVIPDHRAQGTAQQIAYTELIEECTFEMMLMRNKNFDSPEDKLFGEEFVRIMDL